MPTEELPPTVPLGLADVVVIVTNTDYQTMDGFGATTLSLVWGTGLGNTLTNSQRQRAIEAVYQDVGINLGGLEAATPNDLFGASSGYMEPVNDDNDPLNFNWSNFNTLGSDDMKSSLVDLAEPLGFSDYYLASKVNSAWGSPWLATLRGDDYNAYIAEAAELVAAMPIYWRDKFGISPRLISPMNEPLRGNVELRAGANEGDLVDIIKAAGLRLTNGGFTNVKFIVPADETEQRSYDEATAILADPDARQYVGVIAYHPYPYGSKYAGISPILSTSGSGNPDPGRIAVRESLRDLGAAYGIPLWMTEVSNGGVDVRSFDGLRARAIHIHDELKYANASAYFGMNNMWDLTSQRAHFGNDDIYGSRSEGSIVVINNDTDEVVITGMGYAIGHYARWIKPGAVRIDAQADDALVLVSAFRDEAQERRLVLVAINNSSSEREIEFQLDGVEVTGTITGEQSTTDGAWQPLAAASVVSANRVRATVQPLSVTTLSIARP